MRLWLRIEVRKLHPLLGYAARLILTCAVWMTFVISGLGQSATPISSTAVGKENPSQNSTAKTETKSQPATPAATPQARNHLKSGNISFSGSLRLRVENYGWFKTPGFQDDYTFGAAVLRLSLSQQREKVDWLVEGEFPVLINLPERAIAPAPQGQLGLGGSYFAASVRQDASAVLKQAYVRFKTLFGDKPSSLRFGRFEFGDGTEATPADATLAALKRDHIAHRLIGNFSFSHVGRSFDAVQYVRTTNHGNFTFVGGRPTEGVFQLRSLKELGIDFWYGAYTKPLARKRVSSESRVLALHYHDGRDALKTDNRPTALRRADTENLRLTTVGGNYIGRENRPWHSRFVGMGRRRVRRLGQSGASRRRDCLRGWVSAVGLAWQV